MQKLNDHIYYIKVSHIHENIKEYFSGDLLNDDILGEHIPFPKFPLSLFEKIEIQSFDPCQSLTFLHHQSKIKKEWSDSEYDNFFYSESSSLSNFIIDEDSCDLSVGTEDFTISNKQTKPIIEIIDREIRSCRSCQQSCGSTCPEKGQGRSCQQSCGSTCPCLGQGRSYEQSSGSTCPLGQGRNKRKRDEKSDLPSNKTQKYNLRIRDYEPHHIKKSFHKDN